MDKDKGIQPVPIIYDQASISLPLNEDAFKDFMVSLLGQPESIEGFIEGAFEIDIGGFEYLNNLIDDRIAKQNQSSLLEFRAKLFFSDSSSMSFNGIQSFLSYRELRPLICEGFVFTWSYLVKFNNKQASERQEISISSIKEEVSATRNSEKRNLRSPLLFSFGIQGELPKIAYSVRCTDRGWGIEITDLIRRCLAKFIKIDSSLSISLRKKIIENFISVQSSCLFSFLVFIILWTWRVLDSGTRNCQNLLSQADQHIQNEVTIDRKLDFLTRLVSACSEDKASVVSAMLPMFLAFVVTFLLPFIVYILIQLPSYRFLLFTEESVRNRDKYFRKINDRKTFWMVTIFLGIVVGVIGNYFFTWLSNIFR